MTRSLSEIFFLSILIPSEILNMPNVVQEVLLYCTVYTSVTQSGRYSYNLGDWRAKRVKAGVMLYITGVWNLHGSFDDTTWLLDKFSIWHH